MKIPKATEDDRAWFESLVPEAPGVTVRPMFGNLAAFVNGNMFLALLGPSVAIRLDEDDRVELLKQEGATPFEPMGRRTKEYVVLPESWRKQRKRAQEWVGRSLDWAATLPPKVKKPKK